MSMNIEHASRKQNVTMLGKVTIVGYVTPVVVRIKQSGDSQLRSVCTRTIFTAAPRGTEREATVQIYLAPEVGPIHPFHAVH